MSKADQSSRDEPDDAAATPQGLRNPVVERLVGASGEPNHVVNVARAWADRASPDIMRTLNEDLATPVFIEIQAVDLVRTVDIVPNAESFSVMSIAASATSSDALSMVLDPDAIAIMLSCLFGGDADLPLIPITREPSHIERDAASLLFDHVARGFDGSGSRSLGVKFPLKPAISGEELDALIMRDGAAARITLSLNCGPNSGSVSITIPQRVLLQHRETANTAKPANEGMWRSRFNDEVMRSAVELRATVALPSMTLGELACLREGQIIELPENAPSETRLSARDKTVYVCEFGKLGQNFTVRVLRPFDETQEFVDGLLTN